MICPKCTHKTYVNNSRNHNKTAQVWRRRTCPTCGTIFTTYERVALFDELSVLRHQEKAAYVPGRLFLSLYTALQHSDPEAAKNASWLLRSIEDQLVSRYPAVTIQEIKELAHTALANFNTLAGIQYAATYKMLDHIKRPRK